MFSYFCEVLFNFPVRVKESLVHTEKAKWIGRLAEGKDTYQDGVGRVFLE